MASARAAKKKVQRKAAKSAAKPSKPQLTAKQQTFAAEYLANGFNATQAAIAAGYSKKTADSIACRLLKMPPVAAAIDAGKQERLGKLEVTADRVLAEIAKLAFLDPRKLFRDDGSLKPITELDDDTAAAIAGVDSRIEFEERCPVAEIKKIKFADKGANLERLGRYFKLFTDRVEYTGKVSIAWVAELSDAELEAQLKARGVQVGPAKAG